ncbi:sigma-E factor negative regulatory protein [Psychrobium sp. 1_MG-2023]|uniref:sigma-E factor negative regulatory protein n=1 Tax=Psychrobium sp. 1_MG-2023 TaxID=3062624 RepID=UPI00267B3184|nr:RseA family anti-sigma factor [Psychrobium sp. 1_MG-2023]MDP2560893.1 RseA family anti-sigma factor [Psychrobium sp. 1_MG-2023]
MSDNRQTVSSFIDGEELSKELLDQLASDEALQGDFERYHLIGDAIRDELSPAFELDFADKVAAAIELEPTVIAPQATQETTVNEEVSKKPRAEVIPFFGKLGQYGIAASVAAAMVIGVQQFNHEETQSKDIPVLQTIPTGGYASPVSFQAPTTNDLQKKIEQEEQRAQQQHRMNAFVKDHMLQQRLKSQTQEVESEKEPSDKKQ